MLITLTVLAIVVSAVTIVMTGSQRSKASTEANIEAQQSARTILDILARDIRSAGFEADLDGVPPQPPFAYVDSVELILCANLQPATPGNSSAPNPTQPPLALDPIGSPLPIKITGSYLPPVKYQTGAELVRYTFDLNNDGIITALDQNHIAAGGARRTANPDDFVLARIVYGDSSGSVPTAGNNGGAIERVGVLRGPGTGVPALFTVYLGSNPAPWNWANGAVPANRLDEISRVEINVTTESRRPDRNGNFARSTIGTEVNSLRNVPDAGSTLFDADGYVFNDVNQNGNRDTGEPGVPDVVLRMGSVGVDRTNASGYYFMRVPPGQYTLRQDVPSGYGAFTPDSVAVDFFTTPADFTHDFADTSSPGGWIIDTCWVDTNDDAVRDADEWLQDGVIVSVASLTAISDISGHTGFFVAPGTWSLLAMPPESTTVSTPNPVSVTVNDGDTLRVDFGLIAKGSGTVSGRVYKDVNRNYTFDSGEPGMADVWVGISKVGGGALQGWALTMNNGTYEVVVPANMPEMITAYEITLEVPAGHFPVTSSVIAPLWVETGITYPDNDFGIDPFQLVTLNAERVLSLGSGELMEKDWSGPDGYNKYVNNGHKDIDLVLGSEWSANPNISTWFNDWNSSPLFPAVPDYQRNAWSSALSIAVGPIDVDPPWSRADVVTGLQSYASGNIAVWITKGSSGNFGYLSDTPVYYRTLDGGDANAVLLNDLDGDTDLDLIVGTKSYAGSGSFEVWSNSAGVFTREAMFPPYGGVSFLGEVRSMALGDFDDDSDLDLVLVTRTDVNEGSIVWFEKTSSTPPYFALRQEQLLKGEGNAVVTIDINGDGREEAVAGTKTGPSQGRIEAWAREDSDPFDFMAFQERVAPGIVLSLAAADLGGITTQEDLAVGFRGSDVGYAGGVRIYFLDGGSLPTNGSDPTSGTVPFMMPALNTRNFDYGDNPTPGGIPFIDLAAAMKSGPTTGAVLIFLR
jgi:type II secretory pathway pseudopilin PulG